MKEAYIIEVGEYSDRENIAVCFDEKIAESYAKLHHGSIDPVPVIDDETYITQADNMITEYQFFIYNGRFQSVKKDYIESTCERYKNRIGNVYVTGDDVCTYVYVYVDDEEKANKIVRDTFAKLMAERLGL